MPAPCAADQMARAGVTQIMKAHATVDARASAPPKPAYACGVVARVRPAPVVALGVPSAAMGTAFGRPDEPRVRPAAVHPPIIQRRACDGQERHAPAARALSRAIPATEHADTWPRWVQFDVIPLQRRKLALPQPCVDRERECRTRFSAQVRMGE